MSPTGSIVQHQCYCFLLLPAGFKKRYSFGSVGAQGRPPPNVPEWHVEYFELKLLKKWAMREGHSDLPFCLPESRKEISHLKGALPSSGTKRTPLLPEIGNWRQEAWINKPWDFFITPSQNSVLMSSLVLHLKP